MLKNSKFTMFIFFSEGVSVIKMVKFEITGNNYLIVLKMELFGFIQSNSTSRKKEWQKKSVSPEQTGPLGLHYLVRSTCPST